MVPDPRIEVGLSPLTCRTRCARIAGVQPPEIGVDVMSTTVQAFADESFLDGFRRRLQLTGLALAYVFLAVPAVALVCILSTALGVAVVGVGMALLLLFVPLDRQLANVHRRLSGRILGMPIEEPYL